MTGFRVGEDRENRVRGMKYVSGKERAITEKLSEIRGY